MNRKSLLLPALLLAFCLLVGCQTADQPHGAAALIMHTEIQYEDDGHSFTATGTSADGTVQGSVQQIYQPFTAAQGSL